MMKMMSTEEAARRSVMTGKTSLTGKNGHIHTHTHTHTHICMHSKMAIKFSKIRVRVNIRLARHSAGGLCWFHSWLQTQQTCELAIFGHADPLPFPQPPLTTLPHLYLLPSFPSCCHSLVLFAYNFPLAIAVLDTVISSRRFPVKLSECQIKRVCNHVLQLLSVKSQRGVLCHFVSLIFFDWICPDTNLG